MGLDQLNQQTIVETDRFVLRPLRPSDAGLIQHYASDERVARMTSIIPHPYPPGAAEAYVKRAMAAEQGEIIWAMDGTKDDSPELMGLISLKTMDRNQSEVGYWVAPPFWNTGLASMAVSLMVEANPLGDATMFAAVFQDNPASARVLAHCGFEYLGDAESFSVARDATVPTWTYSRKL
ncbi:GNAT family N-acetyltransferase [Phaeobacter sp. HF9A]|uniref:GNAT family N-acetyltransferase n=1 Tax=Phaeobacter sp. HF9A TaxID=2721561 RepID=UPI001430AD7C|nr:GNAT family N-acetyltransferase [Phaeobacter sp. HF9A]NIZ14942.1 GNAT family N-acetyltransferase [Phaeobacter sp. HF9A]